MPRWIFAIVVLVSIPSLCAFAQPSGLKDIPPPPDFLRSLGQTKFDPALLRAAIVFPVSSCMAGSSLNTEKTDDEVLPIAEIRKKLLGDERDADWLYKLGVGLNRIKSPDAKNIFTQSVAAYVKRIKKEPNVSKHYCDITRPLSELDRKDEARACAKRSVELDPNNADGWWELVQHKLADLLTTIYGSESREFIHGETPPPELSRILKPQQVKAIGLLKEIRFCIDHWKRSARLNIERVGDCAAIEADWAIFDGYFRSGKWDRDKHVFQALQSKALQDQLQVHGRDNQDPIAYLYLAMIKITAFARDAKDPSWSPMRLTPEQKKTINEAVAPLETLAIHKDKAIVVKALFVQTIIAHFSGEIQTASVHCERALSIAPREKAIIATMMQVVQKELTDGFEKYWMNHAQKHPSAFVYFGIAAYAFYDKSFDRIDRLLRDAAKIDPKDRNILLVKAAVALKRGEASLAEAGRILDQLESRIDEPNPNSILDVFEVPGFRNSYRYLRAIHTALNGNWEKGRDELIELRGNGVLEKGITAALDAFPRRLIELPLINLDLPIVPITPPSDDRKK